MEVPWRERVPPSFGLLYLAITAVVATAISILVIDQPLARTLAEYQPSGAWDAGIEILEWAILLPVHKLVLPVALVVAMLATVFVRRWRGWAPSVMTIAAVHLLARLVTNWIKDGTGRYRPTEAIKKAADGSFGYEGGISFPSGHVALFASLVIPILYAFPRTRVLAIPLCAVVVFVSIARIAVNAHWVSDTTGSIALIALMTWVVGWGLRPNRA